MNAEEKMILLQAAANALRKMDKYDLKNRPDAAGKFYNHFRQEAYWLSKGEFKNYFPKLKKLRHLTSDDHKYVKKVILRSLDLLFEDRIQELKDIVDTTKVLVDEAATVADKSERTADFLERWDYDGCD